MMRFQRDPLRNRVRAFHRARARARALRVRAYSDPLICTPVTPLLIFAVVRIVRRHVSTRKRGKLSGKTFPPLSARARRRFIISRKYLHVAAFRSVRAMLSCNGELLLPRQKCASKTRFLADDSAATHIEWLVRHERALAGLNPN